MVLVGRVCSFWGCCRGVLSFDVVSLLRTGIITLLQWPVTRPLSRLGHPSRENHAVSKPAYSS